MSVTLKLEFEKEIRRLTVSENELTVDFMIQKCREKFQKLGSAPFVFTYLDEDGDKITLDSQEEISQLINEKKSHDMKTTIHLILEVAPENRANTTFRSQPHPHPHPHPHPQFQFRHPCQQPRPEQSQPSVQPTPPRSPGVQHAEVVCDICQEPIFGIRYKCTVCPNFDVCEKCEKKESNQEIPTHSSQKHFYLMMRRPMSVKETFTLDFRSIGTSATPSANGWLSDIFDLSERIDAVTCDGCGKQIQALRYKCCLCEDFDLCGECIQFAELKHNIEHSFWLKMVPLGLSERLPILSSFYWSKPLLTQFGPILVSTKSLENSGVTNVQIRTHPSHHHPYRQTPNGRGQVRSGSPLQPGDIEIEMDIPMSVLTGAGRTCPFARQHSEPSQVAQPEPQVSIQPVQSQVPERKDETQSTTQEQTGMEVEKKQPENELAPELLRKLKELEEMGFTDLATNLSLLKIFDGEIEPTLNHLLKESQ